MEAQPNDTPSSVLDDKPKAGICPCCGKPTLPYPLKHVPDDLMNQYMVCVISGTPFYHTYNLYGGRVQITVTQMSADTRLPMERLMRAVDAADDHAVELEGVSWDSMRGMIRVFACITKISIKAGDHVKTYEPSRLVATLSDELASVKEPDMNKFLASAYDRLKSPDNVTALPANQLVAVVETHARLVDVLVDAGFDESFWKGIELA